MINTTSKVFKEYKSIFTSMKAPLTILLALLLTTFGFSQNQEQQITIGQKVSIESKTFAQERGLQIYLPEGYSNSNQRYPVLYLLDGEQWFTYSVSINQLMTSYDYTPEFIIVGIETSDSPRFGFFANTGKLIDFLEKDVVTYIDHNYRTSEDRMLFGWQFAAAFTVETMIRKAELFSAYFAASPIPLNDKRLNDVTSLLESTEDLNRTLFFATSLNEKGVEPNALKLKKILEDKAPSELNWEYQMLTNEALPAFGHRTTPLGTIYQGLRKHYHDYPVPEFSNIADFENAGGFDYVKGYFKNRSVKYGLSEEIPQEGKFFLIRLGMDEDHYPTFEKYMEEFIQTDFLDNVNLGWNTRYAEFYLKHNKPAGAITVFQKLIDRFPDNPAPVNGMGDAFRSQGDVKSAKKYYEMAVVLAEKQQSSRLEEYKKDLLDIGN